MASPDNVSDADLSTRYAGTVPKLRQAAFMAVEHNGYRVVVNEDNPDRGLVIGELARQFLFFKSIRAIGIGVTPGGAGGAVVTVVTHAVDDSSDVHEWIAEIIKENPSLGACVVAPMEAAVAAVAPEAPAPAPSREAVNIAVTDFQADGVSAADAAVTTNLLRSEMVKTGAFNLIEKQRMDAIMAEQAFQQTGCTSEDCAVRLGKLLNVRRIIVGNFGRLLGEYFISVRVVDVENGKITYADDIKGDSASAIQSGIKELAARLAGTAI